MAAPVQGATHRSGWGMNVEKDTNDQHYFRFGEKRVYRQPTTMKDYYAAPTGSYCILDNGRIEVSTDGATSSGWTALHNVT